MSGHEPADDSRPIDLHVHTTASDGSLTPSECVAEAARLGLAAIAITDHDTLAGNAEALAAGRDLGVEVVPGVEVSSTDGRYILHILGYYPAEPTPALEGLLRRMRESRDERNPRILARLAELGCPVSANEVAAESGTEVVGRPHIAAVMIRKGYVRTLQEAFDRYLARGAAAYIARVKPTPAHVIATLLEARAVPVLAHPGTIGLPSFEHADALVAELAAAGLRGLEVYYHAHNQQDGAAHSRIARRHGLVETGGTDFHGARKPDIALGRGTGRLHVPYRLLEGLKAERERL